MAKLYFSIHPHQPRLLETTPRGREPYAHDADVAYLVIQPLVLEPLPKTAATGDQILARDYLRTWSAATIAAEGVHLVGADEAELIRSGKVVPCPVPLPPGTQLAFALKAKAKSGSVVDWSDSRPLGLQNPAVNDKWDQLDGDPALGWPAFAALSNALPPVRSWAELDGGTGSGRQTDEAIQGLLAAFSRMAANEPTAADDRTRVWTEVVRPLLRPVPPQLPLPLNETELWRQYLQQPRAGGGTNASWAYDLLLAVSKGETPLVPLEPVISMPAFQWTAAGVRTHPELFLPGGLTERGYLDALWSELRGLAEREAANGGVSTLPVNQILGRLFGFGERLAWPLHRVDGGLQGTKRIMALCADLTHIELPNWIDGKAWLATNVVSLAGLVLRLPWDRADPIETISSAVLSIGGTPVVQKTGELAELLKLGFQALAAVPPRTPGPAQARFGSSGSDHMVFYAARKAPMVRLDGHAPASRILYAVPESLLDVIDSTQRFIDRGTDGRVIRNPPRRALSRDDVLNPADVLPATVGGVPVETWHRRRIELSPRPLTGSAAMGYAIHRVEDFHPREVIVGQWIADLDATAATLPVYLWIPRTESSAASEVRLLPTLLARDADRSMLVLDPDPQAAGSLTKLLGYDSSQPRPFQVELAFLTTAHPSKLFDVIEWPSVSSSSLDLSLKQAPLTRLSRSADRLAGPIGMAWPVDFDPDAASQQLLPPDIQTVQFSETNKLRMSLALPFGGLTRNLSEPDAQLPLPASPPSTPDGKPGLDRPWTKRGDVAVTGPQAWYWFAEHFDQDTARDDDEEEETRFQLWNSPGKPLKISGYLEHQLGHRVEIAMDPIQFQRSVDIVNPADIMVPERVGAGSANPANERKPLLVLREDRSVPSQPRIQIVAQREALQLAFKQHQDGAPGQLRDLYRALAEFRDAVATNNLQFTVESWIYDNESVIGSAAQATLGLGMRPAATTDVPLRPLTGSDLEKLLLALSGTFKAFEMLCGSLVTGSTPLALLYDALSSDFDKTATMLRVKLTLGRPDTARAGAGWGSGPYVPLAEAGPEAGAALAATAEADLKKYLTDADSRLAKSVAWIESDDLLAGQKGMGPGASKFLVPMGDTTPVERVADLFYLPHAFLLPDAHPVLGDRQATVDFLAFLLQLIEDVLAGRPIVDRFKLTGSATPADVVAQRRAIRAILEGTGGALDRMMRLFRRIDEPPQAPGATPVGRLHWHAGQVLDSLSALPKPPTAAVRERLLATPSLFTSLRGIGIAVFNRKLPGNHPAPAINHSTFSSELIELGITKHLHDDRDIVKEDADRFGASEIQGGALPGGSGHYLLDLLPDRVYDDLFEIRSNTYRGVDPTDGDLFGLPRALSDVVKADDVKAVRGEDVLSIEINSGRREASLAANVVHVFPDWRIPEGVGSDRKLRTYYLLPERLPPPKARAVDALHNDAAFFRSEVSLDFTGAPGYPPNISPKDQWARIYDRDVHAKVATLSARSGDGGSKVYRRIQPAAHPTGPAKYLPGAIAAGGTRQSAGWHLLTTYISHFFFELDLQKHGSSWSENLEDDTYEVEVEMWHGTPPSEDGESTDTPASNEPLLAAYRNLRKSAKSGGATPVDITRAQLTDGLKAWLQSGYETKTLLEEPEIPAAQPHQASVRTFRITRPVGEGAWTLTETTKGPQPIAAEGLGAVVAFEVMARTAPGDATGPRYDATVPQHLASVLIRISVLDTPALVSRARLRVVRNWRDVGNDGIPDIAPAFFLSDRFSTWKSEGRAPLVIDERDFDRGHVPDEGRQIRASKATALTDWLDAIDFLNATVNHGNDLAAALQAKVFLNLDTGSKETLWEAWMTSAAFTVDGMVVRTAPDPSVVFGDGPSPLAFDYRGISLAGDPLKRTSADHLADVLAKMRPSRIKTDRPIIVLVWRDAQDMPVLEIALPLNLKP